MVLYMLCAVALCIIHSPEIPSRPRGFVTSIINVEEECGDLFHRAEETCLLRRTCVDTLGGNWELKHLSKCTFRALVFSESEQAAVDFHC